MGTRDVTAVEVPAPVPGKPAGFAPLVLAARTVAALLLVAVAAQFLGNALRSQTPWVNHDVAFHGYLGWRMLEGERLYVDLKDTNPPGSQFLQGALVGLSDRFGVLDFLAQNLLVLLLGAGGLLVLGAAFPDRRSAAILVLTSLALTVVAVRGNFGNSLFPEAPGIPYDFGQREHLFALLFLPYLLFRLSSRRAGPGLLAWCVATGFVAMYKPYWAPMLLAVELEARVRGDRSLAPVAALGAGASLPLVLLALHSTAAFVEFFAGVVPLHLFGAYGHYGNPFAEFAVSPFHLRIVGLALLAAAIATAAYLRGTVRRSTLVLWFVLALIAYLAIVHQHKFWSYHAMVLYGVLVVGAAWFAAPAIEAIRRPRRSALAAVVAVGLLVAAGLQGVAHTRTLLASYPPFGAFVIPLLEGRRNAMIFSTSVDFVYATLRLRLPTVGPWTVHFMVPAMLDEPDPALRRERLTAYAEELSRRIDTDRPEALLFAPYAQALPAGMTLHGLMQDLGVVPRPDYVRVDDLRTVARNPRLAGWILYERQGEP